MITLHQSRYEKNCAEVVRTKNLSADLCIFSCQIPYFCEVIVKFVLLKMKNKYALKMLHFAGYFHFYLPTCEQNGSIFILISSHDFNLYSLHPKAYP